jgi:hypothetical protein
MPLPIAVEVAASLAMYSRNSSSRSIPVRITSRTTTPTAPAIRKTGTCRFWIFWASGPFGWNVSSGELFWSEETFRIFGSYRPSPVGPFTYPNDPAVYAGKPSDDGHVYVGGFTVRMNPDGTNAVNTTGNGALSTAAGTCDVLQ